MRVQKTAKVVLGGLMAATLGLVMMPSASHARARGATGTQVVDPLVAYYDIGDHSGLPYVDNEVRIVNPTKANGNLCAMIYVFDSDEELGSCCGCPLSPNKLDAMSVERDLLSNWALAGRVPKSGVITIVPAVGNVSSCSNGACHTNLGTSCDPTATYTETPTLNAWITHADLLSVPATASVTTPPVVTGTSTVAFALDNTDTAEQTYLTATCQGIISNGSGFGSCSCGDYTD